jgi:SM-20-related protein
MMKPENLAADVAGDSGTVIKKLAAALAERDWVCCRNFLEPDRIAALRREAESMRGSGRFHPAGVGHMAERHAGIRGDDIVWVEESAPLAWRLQQQELAVLREAFNAKLYLGLHDFEGHYAAYPEGAGYARHLDRFRDGNRRVLSLVLYLNQGWDPEDGGELCLYTGAADVEPAARVLPEGGTLVCFLSEHVPHEVKATRRTRWSLSGWFRRRA